MLIHVDAHNGLPIYEQIVRQITFAVAAGELAIEQHVPSVRELSTQLAVNANTVAPAPIELQAEGVLTSIRGTGLAVTSAAPKLCRAARQQLLRDRLRSVLKEALGSGISEDELRGWIDKELRCSAAAAE